jgi:hypothetical protein
MLSKWDRLGVMFVLALTLGGCGESGKDPVLFPEVRFQVQPVSGSASFKVPVLQAGGQQYTSIAGTAFSTTGIFNFVIEGAPGPYTGTFTQTTDDPIRVTLSFNMVNGQAFRRSVQTTGRDSSVVISSVDTPVAPGVQANPEVRFDICSPPFNETDCDLTTGMLGRFGVPFQGNLGDFFNSFLVGQPASVDPPTAAPEILFL